MIGIMNCGSDASVEFYASNRASSLYQRKASKDERTYTADGRVLINGVPETQDTPAELWRSLIYKAATARVIKEMEDKDGGPLAVIRRFSSRLGLRRNPTAVKESIPVEDVEENEELFEGKTQKEKKEREHVTIIRIKTLHKNPEMEAAHEIPIQEQEDGDELRIYAQESILKRLMEEKAMIERQMGNISMEWGSDSAHTSIDETADIIVERF
ncbi:unnamed protein product [Cylicocyclus nassatus]|uniref:Uncharacterized protein n=1 Tax=Cylicocyclus nassatus TaxID=53992 RepID=A0AA36H6I2_CYLNA|nr:unnamed protein product [Cylicocyclus nassatus]